MLILIKTVPVSALRWFCLLWLPLPKKWPVRVYDRVSRTTRLLFIVKCRVNVLKWDETFLFNASWSQIRQARRNTLQIRSRNFATNSFAVETRLKNPGQTCFPNPYFVMSQVQGGKMDQLSDVGGLKWQIQNMSA